jgi:hypothetical protein
MGRHSTYSRDKTQNSEEFYLVCLLPAHAGFLLCLFFDTEGEGKTSVDFQWTTWRYILEQSCPTFLCTRAQFTDAYGGAGATTLLLLLLKLNSVALVRKRTIPTERPPLSAK